MVFDGSGLVMSFFIIVGGLTALAFALIGAAACHSAARKARAPAARASRATTLGLFSGAPMIVAIVVVMIWAELSPRTAVDEVGVVVGLGAVGNLVWVIGALLYATSPPADG